MYNFLVAAGDLIDSLVGIIGFSKFASRNLLKEHMATENNVSTQHESNTILRFYEPETLASLVEFRPYHLPPTNPQDNSHLLAFRKQSKTPIFVELSLEQHR